MALLSFFRDFCRAMEENSLKERTAKGILWGGMSNGLMQLMGAVFGLVLLRYLTPADQGKVAMLNIFAALASALQESGFYRFVMAAEDGEIQPMTVDMLADFMREHEDLLIITDIRLENEAICRELSIRYPDLQNRFIVQIYHEEEYNRIRELGFENLIYTLYQAYDDEWNLWRIAHFAEENELIGITMPRSQFFDVKKRLAMAHCGLPVMFHTVDDPEEISNMLQKPYVYGAYTDLIN